VNAKRLNRRSFLKLLGMTALGTAGACAAPGIHGTPTASVPTSAATPLPPAAPSTSTPTATAKPSPTPASSGTRQRVLRVAQMTDWHILPASIPVDGMVRALRAVQQQPDPPTLIFNTGDSVMDSLKVDKVKVEAEWAAFKGTLRAECRLPIVHAIGNHDVWGWGIQDEWLHDDPIYGKEMAMEQLGLASRYYSFDRAGWHFIVLDSVHRKTALSNVDYVGRLDDAQLNWLAEDVRAVQAGGSTPICILSHIPILAACTFFEGMYEQSGDWDVPAYMMHIDARRFRQLFLHSPNVKVCLSGHTHQYESLHYMGVHYINSGAVSGDWWRGAFIGFPPGYVMVDFFDDGSAESQFVAY
jgi:3',5'-cyclic-AMP phosphodiesterase